MRFGPKGPRGSVLLGHSATLHSHATLHPQFCSPGLASQALIRAAKPSHTAGTLCAIWPKIGCTNKNIKNNIENSIKIHTG
jgi:hypothetical protein